MLTVTALSRMPDTASSRLFCISLTRVRAARQPEVFRFTGQISTYSLFAPLTEGPPDFRSQFFTEASLFFSDGEPPRQKTVFPARACSPGHPVAPYEGNQAAPGQMTHRCVTLFHPLHYSVLQRAALATYRHFFQIVNCTSPA